MASLPSEISLLKLIIQTAPDAIITADADGYILTFSPAAERLFGYAESEVRGKNLTCLMPEPYRSQHDGYMEHYLRTGEKHIIGIGREVHAQRKNGEVFVAELAVGELRLDEVHVFTGFIRDVTDRVDAEDRARQLHRRLERVSRIQMLGELSSALAHEINQPLAAISNFASAAERILATETPDLNTLQQHVMAMAEQTLRAGEIIRRMRKLVDRGAADLKPEDINEIIEEAVRVSRITGHTGPGIELELAESLPKVLADRIQIQQVVLNLMNNAFEAVVEAGSEPVHISSHLSKGRERIKLRANSSEREVVVTVSDTGPGISDDLIDRVFDPLVGNKSNGLGVGLAICRSIIDAHGGRIWAENTGHGAAFHFTLPTVETTS